MKKTIAIYRNLKHNHEFIGECEAWESLDQAARISDPIDVEFTVIASADDAVKDLAVAAAQKELDAAQAKLNGLVNE